MSRERCTIDGSCRELPAQGTDRPVCSGSPRFATRQCGDAAGVLAVASEPSAEPWILRRVTGIVRGQQRDHTDPMGKQGKLWVCDGHVGGLEDVRPFAKE